MATSGTMNGNTVDYSNKYFINWALASQNIASNYSTINWSAYWHFQSNDRDLDNGSAVLGGVTRWSNGGRVYSYTGNFTTRDLLVASGSFNLTHNSDGTKTLVVSGGLTGYLNQRSEGSASFALPTIPRASVPTSNKTSYNIATGEVVTVTTNRVSTSFTHTLEIYRYSGDTAWKTYTGVTTSQSFTLSDADVNSIGAIIPNANSTTMTFRLKTYSGTTLIGTNDITRVFTFPAGTVNPVFSASQITYLDTAAAIVAITTNNQKIVQNQSDLNATYTAATGQKSATITNYKVTLGADVRNFSTATTIDYGTENLAVDTPITVEVTDSRGNKTTVSKTITVLPWALPSAVVTIGRVNNYEDNTEVTAEVTIASVDSKNAIQVLKVRYKKTTDSVYSETAMTSGVTTTLNLNKLYEWNIQVVITDKFGTTTYTALVGKGIPIMFFDTGMLSIGIGKFPSTNSALEVADSYLVAIMKKIYWVGIIVEDYSGVNPGTRPELTGTTWVAWHTGRSPIGIDTSQSEFNSIGEQGGGKTHTLTTGEMPSHTHGQYVTANTGSYGIRRDFVADAATNRYTQGVETYASGGGGAHNNMHPYEVSYFWKRTA